MEQRSFSDVCPDVVVSLLKKNNLILVRNIGISEWNRVVYVVTKDAQPTASGGSTVLFKPKYTAPDRAPEGIELAHFASISQGLACNLPRHGNDSDFKFKIVPPMVRKSLACSLKILIGCFLAVLGV